eukprot:1185450-Prorocentrum_minimum.AAC.1
MGSGTGLGLSRGVPREPQLPIGATRPPARKGRARARARNKGWGKAHLEPADELHSRQPDLHDKQANKHNSMTNSVTNGVTNSACAEWCTAAQKTAEKGRQWRKVAETGEKQCARL